MTLLLVLVCLLAAAVISPAFAAAKPIDAVQIDGSATAPEAADRNETMNLSNNERGRFDFTATINNAALTSYDNYWIELDVNGTTQSSTTYTPATPGGSDTVSLGAYNFPTDNRTYEVTINLFGTGSNLLDSFSFTMIFGDVIAPQLTGTTPADDAAGVSVSADITAVFDESLNPATVTSANIYLNGKSSSVSYDDGTKTVTLNPLGNLAGLTDYTVTIKGNGLKDAAGNAVAAATWNFRTAADAAAAPEIYSRTPDSNAENVSVSTNIVVILSKPVDTATVNGSSVTLKKGSSALPVTIVPVSANSSGRGTITIDPTGPLDNATVYTVTLSGIKDTDGRSLSATSWSFTTAAGALPTVESRSPAANDTNVAIGVQPTIKFSRAMTGSTITSTNAGTANIWLSKTSPSGSRVAADVTYNSATRTATIIPDSDLSYSTVYYVNIDTDVKDSGGVAIAAVNWKFTTGSSRTAQVTSREPAPNDMDVPLDAAISFKFTQAMYNSSVNENNIYLRKSGSTSDVSLSLNYDSSTRIVTLRPDKILSEETTYVVTVSEDVKDADRDPITPVTWSFTTAQVSDVRITSRDPDSGDTGVALDSNITFKFSRSVKSGTVTASTCYLRAADSSSNIPAAVSYSSSSRTVTINPGSPLKSNTSYTVYVTSGVRDLDGNSFSPTSWKFRTKTSSVNITGYTPSGGAADVSVKPAITCTFSTAMDGDTIRSATFYLRRSGSSSSLSATVSYNASTRKAVLEPRYSLEYGTRYTVYVTSDITASDGAALADFSWSFTTIDQSSVGTAARPAVKVDGQYVTFTDAYPYITSSRTMIPFRALFESMNATVDYDAYSKKVTARLGRNTVILYIGKTTAYRNGVPIRLDVAPVSINGRVYIPLRFAGESLGGTVQWDAENHTVIITTP